MTNWTKSMPKLLKKEKREKKLRTVILFITFFGASVCMRQSHPSNRHHLKLKILRYTGNRKQHFETEKFYASHSHTYFTQIIRILLVRVKKPKENKIKVSVSEREKKLLRQE